MNQTETKTHSNKSFTFGLTAVILTLLAIFTIILNKNQNSGLPSLLIGVSLFIAGILSLIGLVYSIRGRREKTTAKKIFGLLLNSGIILLFVFLIIANIVDFIHSLS